MGNCRLKIISSDIKFSILALAISIAGCATAWQPRTLGCADIGTSQILDPDHRFEAKDFSILSPQGSNWCKSVQQAHMIGFTTRKLIGEYAESSPSLEAQAFKQLAGGQSMKVTNTDISSPESIKAFIEKWLAVGHPTAEIGEQVQALLSPTEFSKHFELTRSKVETDNTYEADCARFEAAYVHRDYAGYPWDLDFELSGIACRHPESSENIVLVMYAEERRQGYQDQEFSSKVRLQAERTLRSLEFR